VSLPKQGLFIHPYFSAVRTVLARPRNSFGLTETSLHGNIRLVLARPRSSFRLTEASSHGNIWLVLACPRNRSRSSVGLYRHLLWASRDIFACHHTTCLGPPKKLITPREGPHHQSLCANCDVFASQHVNSYGSPKDTTEAT
jgi:hypothetical protein